MKNAPNPPLSRFRCSLTPEQEQGYTLSRAKLTLRFSPLVLLAIIAMQVYNLLYAFFYTKGQLHTTASRVYTVLYLLLITAAVLTLLLGWRMKARMPDSARQILRLQTGFSFFLILWSACVTVYDQRTSQDISVYLIAALTLAVLAQFTPLQAALIYGSVTFVLYGALPLLQPPGTDNYGVYVNMTLMAIMSVFICCYRYYLERRHYLEQQIIAQQNQTLREIATHDALTRLPNRRFLDDKIPHWYRRCAARDAEICFMMIDIDHFKQYNDAYGHPQGDECLRRVAWRLEHGLVPGQEFLIRYGGEEFLYVGLGVSAPQSREKAEAFCQGIRQLVTGYSDQDSRRVTVSIGIYVARPAGGIPWAEAIDRADQALYQAKHNGRDRWEVFPE